MADQQKDDEILGKAYDSQLMRRLLTYIKPYKKYIILAIILNIVVSALGPLRPYLTKVAFDENIRNKDFQGLLVICAILLGSLMLQALIQYFLTYYTELTGQKIVFDIRMQLFSHVQKLALRYFDKTPVGRTVTRVTNDVDSLNEMFSSGIVSIFSDIFGIIWIFIFMFAMAWDLSLVTLSVLPALIYATFLFRKKVRDNYRDIRKHLARLNSFMQERVTGMNVVQIFAKEKDELKKFTAINKDNKDVNIKSIFYYAVFFPVVEMLSYISVALIIWYGGGEVLQKHLTIGVLLAFMQYTEMFWRPIRDLSDKYNILQGAMASSERIFMLLDDKTIIQDPVQAQTLPSIKGEVEFKDVWFAYNPEEYVLRNVSFKINPGERIAIVGATGAGKTSIINIFTRFYDIQQGSITLDGIDIRDLSKSELRKYIAMVLQDVFLFSGTIKSNISLGNKDITDEKIIEAAKFVGADKFISQLPNGYDEVVKEKGATLSVGQKQLISFARALAYNPQILILDEATSSVDTETEILIQNAIEKLLVGRTSIVIAHRLSTIQNADKILVMHKGELKEAGTHQELLAHKGIYYKLYQLQYKDQELKSA
ncbi:MAG: ABC transporter-like protein [Stygiobacter sp.]|nr:MAG: ABC transporter-like protein [Stygiobacter sp.]KAF0214987.1 MAG: ABC transporter-like [Ignavibacteria bacterium]